MDRKPSLNPTPNIIILVLDTTRARNLSCYGHERPTTPHIDSLAKQGTKFKEVTSVSPWTLPSHASLFTGVPPTIHRTNSLSSTLPSSLETIASYLDRFGYRTVGISNNPWFSTEFGLTRGFDTFHHLFTLFQGDSYRSFVNILTDSSQSVQNRLLKLFSEQSASSLTKNTINAAYRLLNLRDDNGAETAVSKSYQVIGNEEPYLLFVNFLEPHLPYEPSQSHRREFIPERISDSDVDSVNQNARDYNVRNIDMSADDFDILERLYDAEIKYIDEKVNNMTKRLKQCGDWDDTVLFILGDHGENIGEHQLMSHNYSLHETLTRVPLIARFPDYLGKVTDTGSRVSTLDIPATVADMLPDTPNSEFTENQTGTSLFNRNERSYIVAEYLNTVPPIEKMKERCENPQFDVTVYDRKLRAIYKDGYKFIRGSDGSRSLYNVTEDRDEESNLVESKQGLSFNLESELNKWIERHERESLEADGESVQDNVEEKLEDLGYL